MDNEEINNQQEINKKSQLYNLSLSQKNKNNLLPPKNNNYHFLKKILFFNFIIILFSILIYFTFIVPRIEKYKIGKESLEIISLIKDNTKNIEDSLIKISYLITNQNQPDNLFQLQTKSLLIHPLISKNFKENNVLGEKTKKNLLLDDFVIDLKEKTKNLYYIFYNKQKNVAGVKESQLNKIIEKNFRKLLEETIKGEKKIQIAKENLKKGDQLTEKLEKIEKILAENSKDILNETKNYYEEAEKIIIYHKTLSQTVVNINPLINSFINSINLAGASFSNLENIKNPNILEIQTTIDQIQKYINQGYKDIEEINTLTKELENYPLEKLPKEGIKYHKHNLEVISTTKKYMNSQLSTLQNITYLTKDITNKIKTKTITLLDLANYQNKIFEEIKNSSLNESEFSVKINKLILEENNINLSFWQNQDKIRSVNYIYKKINDQKQKIQKFMDKNKVYFLTN